MLSFFFCRGWQRNAQRFLKKASVLLVNPFVWWRFRCHCCRETSCYFNTVQEFEQRTKKYLVSQYWRNLTWTHSYLYPCITEICSPCEVNMTNKSIRVVQLANISSSVTLFVKRLTSLIINEPQPSRTFRIHFFFAYDASSLRLFGQSQPLSKQIVKYGLFRVQPYKGGISSRHTSPLSSKEYKYIVQCVRMAGVKVCWQKVIIITQQK